MAYNDSIKTQDLIEYEFIRSSLLPDYVCLDIGANEGYYTDLMARNTKQVYAFEPEYHNFKALSANMAYNGNENVILVNKAVGNVISQRTLYKSNVNNGMHRIYKSKWNAKHAATQEIDCITIDDNILPLLSRLDFVKIDVEGSEWGVIQGMTKTIGKFMPKIVLEYHWPSLEEYEEGSAFALYNYLKAMYGKVNLMMTSYHGQPESQNIQDINYLLLREITTQYDCRNIYVEQQK